jgi:hypothetical protein
VSVVYQEHLLDVVYKNGRSLLVMSMVKGTDLQGEKWVVSTNGYLVEYDYKRVSKLVFKHNVLK